MDTVEYLIKESFYMPIIWLLLLISAITISIWKFNNNPFLSLPAYLVASLVQAIIFFFNSDYNPKDQRTNDITIFIFTTIECGVFLNVVYKATCNPKLKKTVYCSFLLFIFYCLYLLFFQSISERALRNQFLAESMSLSIPNILYLVELYKLPPKFLLHREPTFWVITGVLSFITGTAPFVLIEFYILSTQEETFHQLQFINYLFYSLLVITIIKAYLCPNLKKTL